MAKNTHNKITNMFNQCDVMAAADFSNDSVLLFINNLEIYILEKSPTMDYASHIRIAILENMDTWPRFLIDKIENKLNAIDNDLAIDLLYWMNN